MVRGRAAAAGAKAPIRPPCLSARPNYAYLENGGTLYHAQAVDAHERKLYDRTKERLTLDEMERIRL
jgi:hypothetical protein